MQTYEENRHKEYNTRQVKRLREKTKQQKSKSNRRLVGNCMQRLDNVSLVLLQTLLGNSLWNLKFLNLYVCECVFWRKVDGNHATRLFVSDVFRINKCHVFGKFFL